MSLWALSSKLIPHYINISKSKLLLEKGEPLVEITENVEGRASTASYIYNPVLDLNNTQCCSVWQRRSL